MLSLSLSLVLLVSLLPPNRQTHAASLRRTTTQHHSGNTNFTTMSFHRPPFTYLFENTATNNIWGLDRIDTLFSRSGYYTYDFEGEDVIAYILDSGVDAGVLDFGDRLEVGTTFYPPQSLGLPGNQDPYGHGTHVASLVGGTMFGVAKKVTLVPVRILDAYGTGSIQGLIQGLDWVLTDSQSRGATRVVVNLSLDAPYSATADAKVAQLQAAGIVVVGAAGNMQLDACMRFPGGSSHLISVGSITSRGVVGGPQVDSISSFSNSGPCVTILAPGTDIPGAEAGQPAGEIIMSGTSMASPHVTGIIALEWNKYPTWSAAQIVNRLKASAAVGAIDMSTCGTTGDDCVTDTPNLLAQAPFAEVLILNNVDVVFTSAPFGSSPSYWPQFTGMTKLFGACSGGAPPVTSTRDVSNAFAVIDLRACGANVNVYNSAKVAAVTGRAIGIIVVSDYCRTWGDTILNLPTNGGNVDVIRVPVVCVSGTDGASAANGASSVSVSLGLVRQLITGSRGTYPWSYVAPAVTLAQTFQEWRVDWSGTATGQRDGSFCVQFSATVSQGTPSKAEFMMALASQQHYMLSTTSTSTDMTDHWYILQAKSGGGVSLNRDTAMVATTRNGVDFSSGANLYVRIGVLDPSSRSWSVEFGRVAADGTASGAPILSFVDNTPLANIDFFSFSALGNGVSVEFDNIMPCGTGAGQLGDYGVQPNTGSGGGGVPSPGWSTAPTSTPTQTSIVVPSCAKLWTRARCKRQGYGQCAWKKGRCGGISSLG